MIKALHTRFTAHPAQVGESYLGHLSVAAGFAFRLALAAGAALVHALLPWLFERTASDIVMRLSAKLSARR
ncbi:MAG: DUF6356 family protein [Pseudomonadota bacterium]